MRFIVKICGVNPVGFLLCYGEDETVFAIGDSVVFAVLETEDVRPVLAVGPQASHD